MENIYIIIYIALWTICLTVHFIKVKSITAGGILLISYLLYAISSYILYNDDYNGRYYVGLSFLPFLILFFLLYIVSNPIIYFSKQKIDRIQKPTLYIINFFCWIYIIMSFINLPNILSNINLIPLLISSTDAGADLYATNVSDSVYSASSMGSGISNLPSLYTNFFSRIIVLFLFYHLTLKVINKKIVIGLCVSILIYVLGYLLTGQRGGSFKMIVSCIITYFALKQFISIRIKKKLRLICSVSLILLCIPYYYLTSSRFSDVSDGNGITSSFFSYTGQGNLNFNLYALDNNGIRYGDRVIPLLKKAIGIENVPNNFWERRWKYKNLKINDESFITFIGDFFLDFGPIMAIVILCAISFIVKRKTHIKNRILLFHQLILIQFLMCMCMEGGMSLYSYADSSNMVIIVYLFMYYVFKYDYLKKHRFHSRLN